LPARLQNTNKSSAVSAVPGTNLATSTAALMLAPLVFRPGLPERAKDLALGVLFVNVSIGGTLTAYAAPPVLMVASTWQWNSAFITAGAAAQRPRWLRIDSAAITPI
jgi:hypothetical protein